jgi:hypothetical protein
MNIKVYQSKRCIVRTLTPPCNQTTIPISIPQLNPCNDSYQRMTLHDQPQVITHLALIVISNERIGFDFENGIEVLTRKDW